MACAINNRNHFANDHQLLPLSVSAEVARAPGMNSRVNGCESMERGCCPRATARQRETSRGDTSRRLTSPSPSPSNSAISTRVTMSPSRAVARQRLPCARVRPCLAPSFELWRECDVNKVGINLLWWRREEEEEFPSVSTEALRSAAFRRSVRADTGRSPVPGRKPRLSTRWRTKERKSCSVRVFNHFLVW